MALVSSDHWLYSLSLAFSIGANVRIWWSTCVNDAMWHGLCYVDPTMSIHSYLTLCLMVPLSMFWTVDSFSDTKISLITIAPRQNIIDSKMIDFYTLQGTSALLVEVSGHETEVYAYLPSSKMQLSEMFRLPLRGLRKVLDKGNSERRVDGHMQRFSLRSFERLYSDYGLSNIAEVSPISIDSKTAERVAGEVEKRAISEEPTTEYSIFSHNSSVVLADAIFSALQKQAIEEINRKGLPGYDANIKTRRAIIKDALIRATKQNGRLKIINETPWIATGYTEIFNGTSSYVENEVDMANLIQRVVENLDKLAGANPNWYNGLCERVHARLEDRELFDSDLLPSDSLFTAARLKAALTLLNLLQSSSKVSIPFQIAPSTL